MSRNTNITSLLTETKTTFPELLIQQIKGQFTHDSNGVITTTGNAIITRIGNLKTAAAALIEAFETEQPKATISEYCHAALTANADLVRLLNSQPYSAIIAKAITESSHLEDVIEDLWRVQL